MIGDEYGMREQRRTAIVVSKALAPGEAASGVAVVMGQLALRSSALYGQSDLVDADGVVHAAIRYNVVVLTGRQAQLMKAAHQAREHGLRYCAFGNKGRSLSNSFAEYAETIRTSPTSALDIVVVGITGEDSAVRMATKGLSLYAPG